MPTDASQEIEGGRDGDDGRDKEVDAGADARPRCVGAEVFLTADETSGELFAVKSATTTGVAALREQRVKAGLRSSHVIPSIGVRADRDASYQLFLEFAPGGSLADEVARRGGRLKERTCRYTEDVAKGLGLA